VQRDLDRGGVFSGGIDWAAVLARIVDVRWARIGDALGQAATARLGTEEGRDWKPLAPEGVVFQEGYGAYKDLSDASDAVQTAAHELHQTLDGAAAQFGIRSVPQFNEVTWTRYPPQKGHITAHHDPDAYTEQSPSSPSPVRQRFE
jgi:hypothetical protein